jgi:hypothetical protein
MRSRPFGRLITGVNKMRFKTLANFSLYTLKKIPDYDGYSVTPDGRVYSHRSGRFMKKSVDGKGYEIVLLVVNGARRRRRVHRLVAITYLGKPTQNGMTVNHKNEIKTDNRVENLEWIELADNLRYGTRGERVGRALSIPVYYDSPDGHMAKYPSMIAAANSEGVSITTIRRELDSGGRWHYASDKKAGRIPVEQYTMGGEYIRTFPSMSAAARSVNVTVDTLRQAAMHNRWTYSAGGYIWRISK